MKKIEIIIKPEKLETVKEVLNDCGVTGLMITNIMGYGNQKGHTQMYRGTVFTVNLLPKIKVETVVTPEKAEQVVAKILQTLPQEYETMGGGKIFVYEVEDAIRIRTGEKGQSAL